MACAYSMHMQTRVAYVVHAPHTILHACPDERSNRGRSTDLRHALHREALQNQQQPMVLTPSRLRTDSRVLLAHATCVWLTNAIWVLLILFKVTPNTCMHGMHTRVHAWQRHSHVVPSLPMHAMSMMPCMVAHPCWLCHYIIRASSFFAGFSWRILHRCNFV